MKYKLILLLCLLVSSNSFLAQNTIISCKINQATTTIGTSILTLSLEFQNMTSDTVTILYPKPHFMDHHFQLSYEYYPQLTKKPYSISLTSNQGCKDENVYRIVSNLDGKKIINHDDILTFYPGEKKIISDITIIYDDLEFCASSNYTVQINYQPEFKNKEDLLNEDEKRIFNLLNSSAIKFESKTVKCAKNRSKKHE